MNDPGRWAPPPRGLEPESFMEHEDFMVGYMLSFDICLELCEGNRDRARALHWNEWANLKKVKT